MKAKVFFTGLLFAVFFLASLSYSQVPPMINYQGKLTTPQGALIDTTVSMVFSIYADEDRSVLLWTEEQPAVEVENGIFDVSLGAVNPLPDTVFKGGVTYLGIKVGDDPEMTPVKQFTTVPYAIYAKYALLGDNDWEVSGNNVFTGHGGIYPSGNVGIGTNNPQQKLHVDGMVVADHIWSANADYVFGIGNTGTPLRDPTSGNREGPVAWFCGHNCVFSEKRNSIELRYGNFQGIGPEGHLDIIQDNTNQTKVRVDFDGNVGIGTTNPQRALHVSDVLRLEPRGEAPSNPSEGDIYMDSSDHKLKVYDGTTWQPCW